MKVFLTYVWALLLQTVPPTTGVTRLIAVATIAIPVVYIILQTVKKAIPSLTGVWAIIVNLVLTSITYVIGLPQEQWFTMNTLLALAASAAGAAGIHGTVKSLSAPSAPGK